PPAGGGAAPLPPPPPPRRALQRRDGIGDPFTQQRLVPGALDRPQDAGGHEQRPHHRDGQRERDQQRHRRHEEREDHDERDGRRRPPEQQVGQRPPRPGRPPGAEQIT